MRDLAFIERKTLGCFVQSRGFDMSPHNQKDMCNFYSESCACLSVTTILRRLPLMRYLRITGHGLRSFVLGNPVQFVESKRHQLLCEIPDGLYVTLPLLL